MHTWRIAQIDRNADLINFGLGQPDFRILPGEIIRRGAAEALDTADPAFLNYGYEYGNEQLRLSLAEISSRLGQYAATADDLLITSGSTFALDLIATLYTTAGDLVFVDEPSYFLALRILQDHQLQIQGIPTRASGLDLDALEAALQQHVPKFLYFIPTYQNPSGATLSTADRERLVALSQQYGFLLVADEVYQLLHYGGSAPPPPLATYAASERVISINSFSKILAPGLRLGWIQSAPSHLQRLASSGLIDSSGGPNPFVSAVVQAAMANGDFEAYLRELQQIFAARVAAMDAALQRYCGERVAYACPDGGYFFWLKLVNGRSAAELLPRARAAGVGFQPGNGFTCRGNLDQFIRLSFAHYDVAEIEEGVRRLGSLL